jgi:hypothetical protein
MASDVTDEAPALDIGALLSMTFEARPSDGLAERVGSRVALTATLSEVARLIFVSPWHWVRNDDDSLVTEDQ